MIFLPCFSHAQENLLLRGQEYLKAGRNDLALETLLLAEQNLQQKNDLNAAQCFNDLGVVYWNTGNKATALNYHEQALAIRESKLEKNDPKLADSYLNIGLIYVQDEFLQAIIYFDKALKIYQTVYGKNDPKVALCYSNIAFAHRFQGNFSEAITYLDQTMDIWENAYEGDHPNKALTLSNKGRVLEEQGNYDEALTLQQQALDQYQRLYGERHPEVANTYFLIGSILMNKKNHRQAVEQFQKSIYANLFDQDYQNIYDLPEVRDYYNADILLFSVQGKAQALEALHFEKTLNPRDIIAALDTYSKCDEVVTQIRRLRLSDADKLKIGSIASEVYDNGIRISSYLRDRTLFRKGNFKRQSFSFCERSKSATLLEAINETKAKSFAGIPDELVLLEDSLKAEISFYEKEVAKADENIEVHKKALFQYQNAYRSLITRLESEYPNYFQLKYAQQQASVTEIQGKLDPQTAMLSYFIGKSSVFIFYITNKDFKVYDYPKSEKLSRLANELRNGIKYRVNTGFDDAAYQLYQQLIPPIGKGISKLIILPDGILGTIPFEALLTQDPSLSSHRYLIQDYAVSYDYAASLFINKSSSAPGQVSGIFLSAPVSFENNELKMPTLPGSEKEVQEIRYLFLSKEDKPTLCVKSEASETAVKSDQLASYRFLHFATHGIVNEAKPELSRIFLTPDPRQDGSLYSGEIYNLKINAELVTLSACETGLGKVEKGEGIIGLSRSLTYAGAKNLVVSLWQVSDASTSELMIDFYKQHLDHSKNNQFGDDLRQAKLSLINGQYRDPYYWAPFILIGQ